MTERINRASCKPHAFPRSMISPRTINWGHRVSARRVPSDSHISWLYVASIHPRHYAHFTHQSSQPVSGPVALVFATISPLSIFKEILALVFYKSLSENVLPVSHSLKTFWLYFDTSYYTDKGQFFCSSSSKVKYCRVI